MIRLQETKKHVISTDAELETFTEVYKRNALELFVIAQNVPENDNAAASQAQKEDTLMTAQTDILQAAAQRKISTADDINSVLELWHQSVIKETCEQDISAADRLILSIYQNRHIPG